jgi:flagellar biosynthetic protein FliR
VTGFEGALAGIGLWLVMSLRATALFASAPLTGEGAFPARLRIVFGLALAAAIGPREPSFDLTQASTLALSGVIVSELAIGLTIGFAANLVFSAFELVGEYISAQCGLGAATAIDPSSGSASRVIAVMLRVTALLLFLSLGGHHELLRAAAHSFELWPIGTPPDPDSFRELASLGTGLFGIALRLSAPISVAMMLAHLAVGILGRLVPQLNLMMLQLPATIAIALGLVVLGASSLVAASARELQGFEERALASALGEG